MPGACASRALAAAGLLLCLPALGAEPIDFKIVARPAHWGGLELPGKPSSHTQRRLHGAVIPHIQRLKESVKGHESYRIYFIKNGRQAQNVYAREKPELPASRCSALLPPRAGAAPAGVGRTCPDRTSAACSVWRRLLHDEPLGGRQDAAVPGSSSLRE